MQQGRSTKKSVKKLKRGRPKANHTNKVKYFLRDVKAWLDEDVGAEKK
jgi:hypothetical protein